MKEKIDKIYTEDVKNHNDLRVLEQDYIDSKVENVMDEVEKHKEELVNEMVKYSNDHTKPCKWDKDGNPTEYSIKINPLVINNYFFKPIIPITCQEPIYNAEKLGMVFDYYCSLIAEVNDKIGYFPSSLTSFCKLAGITLVKLREYRNSPDINMRIVVNKIYDQIGDENITMSQMGMVKERSTIFKMKSQNELVEKEQPKVSINITERPNMDRINERLSKYTQFANKKKK